MMRVSFVRVVNYQIAVDNVQPNKKISDTIGMGFIDETEDIIRALTG
jgi:hypothetical protein